MQLNNTVLGGRLVADPIERKAGEYSVCQFTLAVDKKKKDSGTNFIDCVAWGKTAETICQYVKKGQPLIVVGRLDQSNWEKDGQKHTKVQVVVDNFNFVPTGGDSDRAKKPAEAKKSPIEGAEEISLDMIPF